MVNLLIRSIFIVILKLTILSEFLALDDSKFGLNWYGKFSDLKSDIKDNIEILEMTTRNLEKYKCLIPSEIHRLNLNQNTEQIKKSKISTMNLLDEIYTNKFCSYRIESYWIYELCHGQFVKQYHETKNTGKRSVTESYFLGKYSPENQEPDYFKDDNSQFVPNIHWRTLDGKKVATYAVKYFEGTQCEVLPDKMREITVYYACDENGNDNIATFEEISSCVYEMVVVTKYICAHPAYRPPEKHEQSIECYAVENSPFKPSELIFAEKEFISLKSEESMVKMTGRDGSTFIVHYQKTDAEDNSQIPEDFHHDKIILETNTNTEPSPEFKAHKGSSKNIEDKKMIASFLNGDHCLTGGTGWWKFEICYGKHVIQFHEDENTKMRTNVLLGTWSAENHLEWIKKFKYKRPAANINDRSTFSLLYSNGQLCEASNKNRFVEVKFKCVKDISYAVSIYMVEPKTCEYLLGIESPWFCNFIKHADNDGIPKSNEVEEVNY